LDENRKDRKADGRSESRTNDDLDRAELISRGPGHG
jgi:hypothetical protein